MPAPEYQQFEEEARQKIAEQMSLIGRWQLEAKQLLETDGPNDVRVLEAHLDE